MVGAILSYIASDYPEANAHSDPGAMCTRAEDELSYRLPFCLVFVTLNISDVARKLR